MYDRGTIFHKENLFTNDFWVVILDYESQVVNCQPRSTYEVIQTGGITNSVDRNRTPAERIHDLAEESRTTVGADPVEAPPEFVAALEEEGL